MKRERKAFFVKRNVLLTLMILCTVFLSSLPVAAKTRKEIGWWKEFGSVVGAVQNRTIQIEQGQEFYLGYYFIDFAIDTNTYKTKSKLGTELNLTYKSSKPAVASVGRKNGLVKAKKVGEAKVYFTYKGKKYSCTVKVKKKNALKMATVYKKLSKASKALAKYAGKKVTAGNVVAMIPKANTYLNEMKKLSGSKQPIYGLVGGGKRPEKLVAPNDWICQDVVLAIDNYVSKHIPKLTVSKVSGNAGSSTITVELKKAPTKQDVYFMQWDLSTMNLIKMSASKVTFETYVEGVSEGAGFCTITKGSKKATIKLHDFEGKAVKLTAGKTYKVALGGNTKGFTAK